MRTVAATANASSTTASKMEPVPSLATNDSQSSCPAILGVIIMAWDPHAEVKTVDMQAVVVVSDKVEYCHDGQGPTMEIVDHSNGRTIADADGTEVEWEEGKQSSKPLSSLKESWSCSTQPSGREGSRLFGKSRINKTVHTDKNRTGGMTDHMNGGQAGGCGR